MKTNVTAFLATLRFILGTWYLDRPFTSIDNGDQFGGKKFPSLENKKAKVGAFRFNKKEWDRIAAKHNLKDFSRDYQVKAVLHFIESKKAHDDVLNGEIEKALYKCRALYKLPKMTTKKEKEDQMNMLLKFYQKQGGELKQ